MNPESPKNPGEELELRITALLLGELSEDEAAALRQSIAQDAELSRLHDRLKFAIELTRETTVAPSEEEAEKPDTLKLAPERRAKLLAAFAAPKMIKLVAARRKHRRELLALAAMLAVLLAVASVLLPSLARSKAKARAQRLAWEGGRPLVAVLADREDGAQPAFAEKEIQDLNGDDRLVQTVPARPLRSPPARYYTATPPPANQPAPSAPVDSPASARAVTDLALGTVPAKPPSAATAVGDAVSESIRRSVGVKDAESEKQAAAYRGRIALPEAEVPRGEDDVALRSNVTDFFSDSKLESANQFRWAAPSGGGGSGGGAGGPNQIAQTPAPAQPDGRETFELPPLRDERGALINMSAGGGLAGPSPGLPAQGLGTQIAGGTLLTPPAVDHFDSGIRYKQTVDPKLPAIARREVEFSQDARKKLEAHELAKQQTPQEEWTRAKIDLSAGKDSVERIPADALGAMINLYSEFAIPPVDPATGLPVTRAETRSSTVTGDGSGVVLPQITNPAWFGVTDRALSYGTTTNGAVNFSTFADTVSPDQPTAGSFQKRLRGIVNRAANPGNVEFDSDAAQNNDFNADGLRTWRFDVPGQAAAENRPAAAPVIVDGLAGHPAAKQRGLTDPEGKAASGPAAVGYEMATVTPVTPEQLAQIKREAEEEQRLTSRSVEVLKKDLAEVEQKIVERPDVEALKGKTTEIKQKLAREEERERHSKALLEALNTGLEKQVDADAGPSKPATPPPVPQPEIVAAENRFSTFSLNVSDVSFKLAAASLEKGALPEPATVRTEEFINAFDYRDPEPGGSAPIAFAWERARYPFAHDRDLVRFSVKTAASGRQPGRPLNLVLLLDNSGSMERSDRLRIRQECLRVLASQLQTNDRISVVAFARTPQLWVDGLPGNQSSELPQRVGGLTPQGGTNLEEAMNLAYQTALRHFRPDGVNRVVLLTDGAANLGDVEPESLKKKVEANRRQGIALDCFGIGWEGYNDDLLEVLSRNGDGRYGFVNTTEAASSEFAGQLAGALKVAASDVKVQVEFNPRRVTAYRQMGYAKHQLTKEQFRDNTVDAAEIGAAEAGNALYVVQVNPRGEGPLGTVRVRFKVPGTGDYREQEWLVAYDGAAKPLEQSPFPMRLAGTAAAFSEWLVSSPYAAEVAPDRLLRYLSGVPESCPADPRPKKLEWMIRQAKSVAGK